VLVDITKDAQQASCEPEFSDEPVRMRGYRPEHRAAQTDLARAAELIDRAKRPVILAGHGIVKAEADKLLRAFVIKTGIPVASTLLGLGGFPATHPLSLGMMGMHGEAFVNSAIQRADLLLAFGMRFDDRVTGNLKTYALNAKKIHVEIDESEVNKNVKVDVALISDLLAALKSLGPIVEKKRHDAWLAEIEKGRAETRSRDIVHRESDGVLLAPHVMHDLWRTTGGSSVIVTDVGQHQMWEAQYYKHDAPRTLITSGGLGTMGFALPAAIGAKFARPDAEVWVVAGDGGFQMTQCELATIQQEGLDVKIAVINNGFLGMVRQWQEFFHQKRYAATPILSPDYVKLAAAYDIPAHRVRSRGDVAPVVQQARETKGPVLIEFQVEKEEAVYPMVPAGSDLHAMIRRPAEENAEVRS
jgi:acetolactate synthase I/II/III large subunit